MENTSVARDNTSGDAVSQEEAGALVSLLVPVIMFTLGLSGNTLALVVLWRSRRENSQSVFYRLVAGLALTDLSGTLATSPVTIAVYSNGRRWVGGTSLCAYFSFMMIFAGLATAFIVGTMALERYLGMRHPYFYREHVSASSVNFTLCLVWTLAAFVSCLPLVGVGSNVLQYPNTWCFFDFSSDSTYSQAFSFIYSSLGLLIIALTAICNIAVMCVLLRMRRLARAARHPGRQEDIFNVTSEMRMVFFVVGVMAAFTTCYAPLMVWVIVRATNVWPQNKATDLAVIRLASLNQILDPWVYLLLRRRLVEIVCFACRPMSPKHQSFSQFQPFVRPEGALKATPGLGLSPNPKQ